MNSRRQFMFAILSVSFFAAGCAGPNQQSGNRLVGDWECVSAAVDGNPLPEAVVKTLKLKISGDRYVTTRGDEALFDSTYRLDSRAKPARIFLLGNEGELSGKEIEGIYLLEGDRLTICYVLAAGPGPTKFESAPGSKAFLVRWQRVRP